MADAGIDKHRRRCKLEKRSRVLKREVTQRRQCTLRNWAPSSVPRLQESSLPDPSSMVNVLRYYCLNDKLAIFIRFIYSNSRLLILDFLWPVGHEKSKKQY